VSDKTREVFVERLEDDLKGDLDFPSDVHIAFVLTEA
jgi:hypothetical protein